MHIHCIHYSVDAIHWNNSWTCTTVVMVERGRDKVWMSPCCDRMWSVSNNMIVDLWLLWLMQTINKPYDTALTNPTITDKHSWRNKLWSHFVTEADNVDLIRFTKPVGEELVCEDSQSQHTNECPLQSTRQVRNKQITFWKKNLRNCHEEAKRCDEAKRRDIKAISCLFCLFVCSEKILEVEHNYYFSK